MTNQNTITIAEYQLKRAELTGYEVHHRGYRVVSVTLTTLDSQSPEYWLETEGGCGSFAGTEILTITQRNTLNSGMNTDELFEKIEIIFRISKSAAIGMHQFRHDETIETTLKREIPKAQAALATLREQMTTMQAAIDEWERIATVETSSMDEAVAVCDMLAELATRNQSNKQEE